MKNLYAICGIVVSACLTTGCGSIDTFDLDKGQSIAMDASKRVIIVTAYTYSKGEKKGATERRVCAEPSPDAITALSAQLAAKADTGQGMNAQVAAGFQQAAASLGRRTQTIQILRDFFYRACEGRINGLIEDKHIPIILSGIDDLAIGLVAVDGLTGMQPAPAVVVAASGSAEANKDGANVKPTVVTPVLESLREKNTSLMQEAVAKQVVEVVKVVLASASASKKELFKALADAEKNNKKTP